MSPKCYYGFICIVGLFKFCYCQQKNTQVIDPVLEKQFMVYFVEAPSPNKNSETWLCGGALVSPTQILTAAACLVKANKIYAIAGYKKYVYTKDIENDECTKARKQRVVRILIPTEYKTVLKNPAQWISEDAHVDVGVAIVEKPYNFSDLSYRTLCSYEPQPIFVNFENKYELTSTRAVAFGWTNPNLKTPGDKTQLLQEASTVLIDKKVCSNTVNSQQLVYIIEKYFLCASNNINDEKKVVEEVPVIKDCKLRRYDLTKATDVNGCLEDDFKFRRHNDNDTEIYRTIKDISQRNFTSVKNGSNDENYNFTSANSRRSSESCQIGHGCPLIKRVGDKKIVIGVATYANKNNECSGPFLYVSTAAASKIIKCLLETNVITRKFCNQEINNKRYEVEEIEINWPGAAHKPQINVFPVKRAVSDDSPLIPRPTRDIYIESRTYKKSNFKSYNQAQKPEYKIDQLQSYDQNLHPPPYYGILRESYEPPAQDANTVKPKLGQQYESLLEQPSPLNQQYMQPPVQQYGPPSDQQYGVLQGQYEPPLGQEYELPPGQQYYPQQRQPFDPQIGQQYEQQSVHQYEPQPGQEYEPSVGHDYSQPSEQQYDPQSSLPLDAQGSQQYEPQSSQKYEQSSEQQYEASSNKKSGSSQLQITGSPIGEQYDRPVNQYEPTSVQYELPLDQQYRQQAGEYKTASDSQYKQRQIQQQPPIGQYVSSQDQQYNKSPSLFQRLQLQEPSQTELQSQLQTQLQEQPQGQWRRQPQAQSLGQSQGQTQEQSQAQSQGNLPQIQSQPQLQEQSQGYFQSHRQLVDPEIISNVEVQLPLFDEQSPTSTEKVEFQNEKSAYLAVIQGPQTFDQIFSQMHNISSEAPQSKETFEQLFSHLHEPSFDLPHESTIPQYSGPSDEPYEEKEHYAVKSSINRESETRNGATLSNDNIKVRPQMPMDYQNDYFFYSSRRNGNNS